MVGCSLVRDGATLVWDDEGPVTDEEAIVLVHGAGYDATTFAGVTATLVSHGHRVLRPDLRGMGRSTDPEAVVTQEGPAVLGPDLVAVLDAAGIEQAHLAGHSLGGWAALGAALVAPGRVARMTLVGTIAGIFTPDVERFWESFTLRLLDGAPPAMADAVERIRATAPPLAAVAEVGRRTPTLFVVGADDAVYPPPVVRSAASAVPGAAVHVVPGAGHHVHLDQPDELVAAMLAD